MLELVKAVASLTFLLVASYFDYREREVPDTVWVVFILATLPLTLIELYFSPSLVMGTLLSIAFSIAVFVTIFSLGFYGGADAKALISLSLAMPLPPSQTTTLALGYLLPFFPVSVLNNTLVLSVMVLPYAPISNVLWKLRNRSPLFSGLESEPVSKKIAALLLCINTEKSKIKPYDSIAEEITVAPDGKVLRRLVVSWRVEGETQRSIDYEELPQDVFVSFSLPMLLFIASGFVTALFLGDIILWLVGSMFKMI